MSYLSSMNKLALDKKIALTKQAQLELISMYSTMIGDLSKELKKAGTLQQKFIEGRIRALYTELTTYMEGACKEAAQCAVSLHQDTLQHIVNKSGNELQFDRVFSDIPFQVLETMKLGGIYSDGKGLSPRIWYLTKKAKDDIENIVYGGIAKGTSADKLAHVLEEYVAPSKRKIWDRHKIKELLGEGYASANKYIEYNALRLARTSIAHSFTLGNKLSAERNPFVTHFKWHSVFAHGRTCQICKDRDGKIYTIKKLPYDHPNGLCWEEPVYEKELSYYSDRIKKWIDGKDDKLLNRWYDKWYGGERPQKQKPKQQQSIKLTPEIVKQKIKENSRGTKSLLQNYRHWVGKLAEQELGLNNRIDTHTINWEHLKNIKVTFKVGGQEFKVFNPFIENAQQGKLWTELWKDFSTNVKTMDDWGKYVQKITNQFIEKRVKDDTVRQVNSRFISELNSRKMLITNKVKQSKMVIPDAAISDFSKKAFTPKVKPNMYSKNADSLALQKALEFLTTKIDKSLAYNMPKDGFYLEYMRSNSRAYARGNKGIHVATNSNPTTIVHETGHIIHNSNTEVSNLIKLWFKDRTRTDEIKSIYFGTKEKGYKDDFITHYIGKVYPFNEGDSGFEVFSMGLQYMFENPGQFYKEDPDHFKLIYGIIRGVY